MIQLLEKRKDGICLYELSNAYLKVLVSSYGCTLMQIDVLDQGEWHNVILGYPTMEDYMARSGTYFGALVGRTANRIAKGEYTINRKTYHCAVNNGPNSLHGGEEGFSYKNFASRVEEDKLVFTYHSPDGEEGYPGNLDLTCSMWLEDNRLVIDYSAVCDQDTLISLTHHTYFNLNDQEANALDHLLKIEADRHGCVDENTLANGQFREVASTPLDYRDYAPVSQAMDFEDEQIRNGAGIDHHFVWRDENAALFLKDPHSGREVKVETTMPGAQVYSGNFVGKSAGRNGKSYDQYWGIAVEPQSVPDNIHNQEHPDSLLKAGDTYHEQIVYTFITQ